MTSIPASGVTGVPSGYKKLDELTAGFQPSDLVVLAGRPSMGKTAFALSMARNIAVEHKRPIAFFSLEMSSIQLVNRLIVAEAEIPSEKIRADFPENQFQYNRARQDRCPPAGPCERRAPLPWFHPASPCQRPEAPSEPGGRFCQMSGITAYGRTATARAST